MRVSENRYEKDKRSLDVALRFLQHDARTQLIRRWTGISDDRIRKLYNTYLRQTKCVPRHRGKSPHQVAIFARTLRMQQEAAWLASLLALIGVIPAEPSSEAALDLPGLARGKLLCDAFETYRAMVPSAQISFDHAVFLATTLAHGVRLRFATCLDCGSLLVIDALSLRDRRCYQCGHQLSKASV